MAGFSHLDREGAARMVDVGEKGVIRRTAVAAGRVRMSPGTVELLGEKALPKGDALNTARIAGVMAAKRTPDLIPLCHGLNLTAVDVTFEVREDEEIGRGVKAYTAAKPRPCNTLHAMITGVRLC